MSDHGGHRLHGPCRDLAAGTELKAGTLAAIAAWCLKSNHYTYANETDRAELQEGDEAVGLLLPGSVQGGASLRMRRWQHELQPGKRDILDRKSEKRASFWEWLGHTAAEGSNEAPNSSKRKHLAKDHTRWRHLPTEDGHFPVPEMRGQAQ